MRLLPLLLLAACSTGSGPCPTALPADGSDCPRISLACEYGGDAHGRCRSLAYCDSTSANPRLHWSVTVAPSTCGARPAGCPSAFGPAAPGAVACPVGDNDTCEYDEGLCGCIPCGAGGAFYYQCVPWGASTSGCPTTAPPLGSACAAPGTTCRYSSCCSLLPTGGTLACDAATGTWQRAVDTACKCAVEVCQPST